MSELSERSVVLQEDHWKWFPLVIVCLFLFRNRIVVWFLSNDYLIIVPIVLLQYFKPASK